MTQTIDSQSAKGNVHRVYGQIKLMASNFQFKPDQRINETTLARELGTSRTPLREALNRLTAEGLLKFKTGKGFYCRSLNTKKILELFEARKAIERQAVISACERASEEEIAEFVSFARQFETVYTNSNTMDLVHADEEFHIRLALLSGNSLLANILENINAQIRFVRWVDMEERRSVTHGEHVAIANAIASRDTATATKTLEEHVSRRSDEIAAVVRKGFAELYVESHDED